MKTVGQDLSIPCDDVCYLNQMPRDILDYIAGFLMETEEEFVARIRVEYEEIQKEREEKQKEIDKQGWFGECGHIPMFKACNIDQMKCLVYFQNNLILHDYIDPDEGYINTQYSHTEERVVNYTSIALSPKGRLFACYYHKDCSFEEALCQKGLCAETNMNILEITKIDTQKKQDKNHVLIVKENRQLYSGRPLCINQIAFNKQGNKLIVYDSCNSFDPKIFCLKNVDQSKIQAAPKITNKLQVYLRDKFVCDKYIEGKK